MGVAAVVALVACGSPTRQIVTVPAAPSSLTSGDIAGDWYVRWDRGFTSWQPTFFDGELSLQRVGDAWSGDLAFNQSQARFSFQSAQVDGARFDLHFLAESSKGKDEVEIWGIAHDGRLLAEMRWGQSIGWNPFGAHRHGAASASGASPPDAARNPPVDITGEWNVRWDRGFTGWKPTIFEGKLAVQRSGADWSGGIAFRQSRAHWTLRDVHIDGDRVDLHFDVEDPDGKKEGFELWAVIRDGRLLGEARSDNVPWTAFGGHRPAVPPANPNAVEHSL